MTETPAEMPVEELPPLNSFKDELQQHIKSRNLDFKVSPDQFAALASGDITNITISVGSLPLQKGDALRIYHDIKGGGVSPKLMFVVANVLFGETNGIKEGYAVVNILRISFTKPATAGPEQPATPPPGRPPKSEPEIIPPQR